jgi:hypothetical protein
MPAIAIKRFFNTIITTISYNRIASTIHIKEKFFKQRLYNKIKCVTGFK